MDADSGDYGNVRYELVRGSGEVFQVDRDTGKVVLKQQLALPGQLVTLTVASYDGGTPPLSAHSQVIIR